MKDILNYLGFYQTEDTKHRFTYIVNIVSLGLVSSYFIFYLIVIRSAFVNLLTLFNFTLFILVFYLLKHQFYLASKLLMIFGFFLQEAALVFLWFPSDTHFNFFYFIIAPITFLVFNFEKKNERTLTIVINVIAALFLVLSETIHTVPFITLSDPLVKILSGISIISAIGSIAFVYYIYAFNLAKVHSELKTLAETDSLTNIANRRVLFQEGDALFRLCRKYKRHMTLILFDIDFFKNINDTHGHPAGDEVLIELTELINKNIRKKDLFARYGGEEFAIILKDTDAEDNLRIATSLKETIDEHIFGTNIGLSLHLTVSAGIANFKKHYPDFDNMVMAADKALYIAKSNGRNQVIVG